MIDRQKYLSASPYEADGNRKIGKHPEALSKEELENLPGPRSLTKAVRAFCIECSGGNDREARKCVAITCQLWPFRMGMNVFRSKGIR